jgi:hypothetical protein
MDKKMFEDWIKREPRKTGQKGISNTVKFSISKRKKEGQRPYGNIFISSDILKAYFINFGDKVSLLSSPIDEKQIFIKKSDDEKGYTISKIGKKEERTATFGRMTFTLWIEDKEFIETIQSLKTTIVHHDLINGGILININ